MTIRRSLCAIAAIVLCASTARAQDPSKIGITMGYPASVGILWNASNTIALRPTIDFAGTSATESGVATSTDRSVSFGADVLFYVRKYDRLRTYVAPHLDYAHGSNRSQPTAGGTAISGNDSAVGLAGVFGAQYGLSDRFGLFGEVGFGFSHATVSTTFSAPTQTTFGSLPPTSGSSNAWGTRAGIGVFFYP